MVAAVGCGSAEDTGGGSAAAPGTSAPAAAPLAQQLTVDEVAVYQAVKAIVVQSGGIVEKTNAPVIANRPAYVRVFVKAIGRVRPTIEAELILKRPGKPDLVLKDGGKRAVPVVDDEDLGTTMNFPVAAEEITPETSFTMRIAPKLEGATEVVTFPPDGSAVPLRAKTASQQLKVKFVPVTMDDAGTSLVPDLADVSFYRDALYRMYPVADVEITVREPFKWTQAVEPDGEGWDDLLKGIVQLRRADESPQNVYYVGVLTPKRSIDEFCSRGGCVLGIAPQADERDVNLRVALVLGYKNRSSAGTLAQELAHAMGRAHAPCGNPQAIDPEYPYSSGSIGVWGYDIVGKEWISPGGRYKDFMSYCSPVWVSDYTYQGIYDRMELVQRQAEELAQTPPKTMQSFEVGKDGALTMGPALDVLPGEHKGEQVTVSYEGSGGTLATTKGYVRPIAGLRGKSFVIAEPAPPSATKARLAGYGVIDLRSASLPARKAR